MSTSIPPDNPPLPAKGPPDPFLLEMPTPPSPSSVITGLPEELLPSYAQLDPSIIPLICALHDGPLQHHLELGCAEWFATATALTAALNIGLKHFVSTPPELSNQITQSPWFPVALAELKSSVARFQVHPATNDPQIINDLQQWRVNFTADARRQMAPHISIEIDAWRSARFDQLKNQAQKEIDSEINLWASQHRQNTQQKGNLPSPKKQSARPGSALGKRDLNKMSDADSDSDMDDALSPSPSPRTDLSRTPRAKRFALAQSKTALGQSTKPTPISVPAPDPFFEKLSAVLDQRLNPILTRLMALENSSTSLPRPSPLNRNQAPAGPPPAVTNQATSNTPQTNSLPKQNPSSLPASRQKKKGKAQTSYAGAAASTPPTVTNPKPPPSDNIRPQQPPNPPRPKSTEITVQRPNTPMESFTNRRSPDIIVSQVQRALSEVKANLPLLYGRWAAHTNNFVYVFSGDIPFNRIQQIAKHLLAPFSGGTLAPVGGWSRILLSNVPTTKLDKTIYSEAELEIALRLNPVLSNVQFVMPPRWLLRPEDIKNPYAALTFSIHDPDSTLTKAILHTPIGAFGARALARCFESRPPLRQCA
jgi:hypothetical protein